MAECKYPQTETSIARLQASAKAAVQRIVAKTPTPVDDMIANYLVGQLSAAVVDVALATAVGSAADALDKIAAA